MKIGEIDISPVTPTKTGPYLIRARNASFTGIGLLMGNNSLRLANGQRVPADEFWCYGPLQFTELPDKLHTTYKIDPQWRETGAPGRS